MRMRHSGVDIPNQDLVPTQPVSLVGCDLSVRRRLPALKTSVAIKDTDGVSCGPFADPCEFHDPRIVGSIGQAFRTVLGKRSR